MIKVMGKNLSNELLIMIVLIILYSVGIVGFCIPELKVVMLPISGTILYLTTIGVVLSSRDILKNLLFLFIAFCIGFSAEVIGVKTGVLFGDYSYGSNLGYKFAGVPIVIGLLWGVLAVGSASCVAQFPNLKKQAPFLAALLMLSLIHI